MTLPLLRPALLVAVVLNVIYVFNSFPIVWTLNDRNPGFGHDTHDHLHVQDRVQERGCATSAWPPRSASSTC